jgi:Spy/CpxP family protein refolding chaperone
MALFSLIFICSNSLAQRSPAHFEQKIQTIKALSAEEIQGYLAGHGMGLAKAAELNHYPGPKHVLELAGQLKLSSEQRLQTQNVFEEMLSEAVRLGRIYIAKEKMLDSLFAAAQMDERQLRTLVSEIERIRGELRLVHLKAHLAMKAILSEKQIAEYDRLRGYSNSQGEKHQPHH